jgi:hypothetical protein
VRVVIAFQSFEVGDTAILNSTERKLLTWYRDNRTKQLTLWKAWRPAMPRIIAVLVIGALAIVMLPESRPVWLAVGIILGGLLAQLQRTTQSLRVLPALFRVIDWNKVDEVLADDASGKNTSQTQQ